MRVYRELLLRVNTSLLLDMQGLVGTNLSRVQLHAAPGVYQLDAELNSLCADRWNDLHKQKLPKGNRPYPSERELALIRSS